MSVVAQRYQDLFQAERRPPRAASTAVDRVEHYRSLYEETQCSVVAAQAEVTSLQVQLDQANLELRDKDDSIAHITEQCNLLRVQVAEKEAKLQQFNRKLSSIKAGVRKELEKQRAGAHDIQLALDCVLRCSRELCTHTITTEEFHESVDLILTTLTPHTNLLAMPTSSENGAEFGEAGRQKLASQSLSERRLQLSGMVSTNASSINQLDKEDVGDSPPPPPPRLPQTHTDNCKEKEPHKPSEMISPYETMDSVTVSRRHGDDRKGGVVRQERGRRKLRYYSSDNALVTLSGVREGGGVTGESYSGGQLQLWRKRLGLREGSVFTGSLPDLAREEEEEEEEDEGGEDEYIDPAELASAFISPRLDRRNTQRLLKRMDTMMNQATPTYLRIIPPDEGNGRSLRKTRVLERSGAVSCYTTDDDLSSVDWDAGEEPEQVDTSPAPNHTHPEDPNDASSPAPNHTHRDNKVRRRKSSRSAAVVRRDSDDEEAGERIYECIEDLALPTCDLPEDPSASRLHVPPQQLPLPRRRSKHRRLRYSLMKGLDGYEYLDTSPTGEGASIPRWTELSPALPPPRKTSAPPPTGEGDHLPIQPTLSVPMEPSYNSHSPAISSDEMNQSDDETSPELLYTTPSFVTMETRPHSTVEGVGGEEGERRHQPLSAKKSNTLPASHKHKGVDHCGYLTKLDARLKPGRRRWFVLTQQELRYYRSKETSLGRPRKVLNLTSWCKLAVINDVTFKMMTSTQTYHLCGGSVRETEEWIMALRSLLRRPSETPPHHTRSLSSPSLISGWANLSENGVSKKVWCQLDSSGNLSVSTQPQAEPVQRVSVASSSVRKVRDSLFMDSKDSASSLSSQLVIQREGDLPQLLLTPCNAEEKETWFYQLSVASQNGRKEALELTPTEQCLATIFREDGDLDHPLWKHPVLNVTDSPLRSSLTSLPYPSLTNRAFRLFQNVQMFMSTPLSQLSLEGHVTATQLLTSTCLRHPSLCDELYCQLLRQIANDDQGPPSRPLQRGWCLLSLVLCVFLPRQQRVERYLTASLRRALASSQPILSGFAQHCLDTVERVASTEQRKWRPSSQELEGLLSCFSANPTSLKLSLSLPVHLPDGTTEEVEFDGCSTVSELLTQLNTRLGMPLSLETGFSLMSDWPGVEECAFFQLPVAGKMGDLLTCWWHAMEELSLSGEGVVVPSRNRCIRLTYRNRLFLRSRRGQEEEREAELLTYQISHEVVSGRHAVASQREAIKMAAIMAQLEFGDWERVEEGEGDGLAVAREALLKFGPMKLTQMTLEHDQSLYQQWLIEWWGLCAGKSRSQCAREFLVLALYWDLCGATLFLAEKTRGRSVWLAVHENGVSLLSPTSMKPRSAFSWSQLAAFGSDGDHLVLVVTSSDNGSHGNAAETEKLLFFMSKAKIHQATNLMTSYLESRKNKT